MAKRFTDTELWDKEWFMKLSPKLKCLVKMVRDKCDLSGVWHPNWTIANAYIGESVCEQDLLNIDSGNQFKKTESGKIICIDFVTFQYGKLSEKSPVHRKVIGMLNSHKIDYKYPINSLKEEDKEEEEEKDKEVKGRYLVFKNSVLTQEIWWAEICMKLRIRKDQLPLALDNFITHCILGGEVHLEEKDFKSHFRNWSLKLGSKVLGDTKQEHKIAQVGPDGKYART